MPTPLLFLDIDGVLNDRVYLNCPEVRAARLRVDPDEWLGRQCLDIDPSRVRVLNRILDDTCATVIVHSTWRRMFELDELQRMLEMRGFTGHLGGVTEVELVERVESIRSFLSFVQRRGRPVPFAVLDDEDLSHDAVIAPRFVRTGMEPHEALADRHADQVRRLLA